MRMRKAFALLIIFSLLSAMIIALSTTNTVHAAGVVDTITVGFEPYGIVYDSGKGEIFVANQLDGTMSVISDTTNTVVATIAEGGNLGIAYDSGKGEIFVANTGSVSVISDSNNTVIANLLLGYGYAPTRPTGIAYDSAKGEIFVTLYNVDVVVVISDSTNKVVATIPVKHQPAGVAYDSGMGEIYVANSGGNSISVISDSTNTVVATISVGNGPTEVAYDSGKGEIFVTNYDDGTVSVISDVSKTVVATIPVGNGPSGVAYDSGKDEVFVANYLDGTVSVISDSSNTVVETIPAGREPYGVAYDSGKDEIFVTNYYYGSRGPLPPLVSNTVLVISDFYPLAAPFVSSLPDMVYRGQTSNLTSTTATTGLPPYLYQWFSKAPNASSYSSISNATSSSYNFTALTSTAMGNWTFILQVTDATGASVNSTAILVSVGAPVAFPSSIIVTATVSAVLIIVALLVYFKRYKRKSTVIQGNV